ncbi:hypothetical protein C8R44DRAFT_744231 [Mycena epipterygia]|nr:hypothetical protein C8R44DRAFT_744231 [Mycena epipterygia]
MLIYPIFHIVSQRQHLTQRDADPASKNILACAEDDRLCDVRIAISLTPRALHLHKVPTSRDAQLQWRAEDQSVSRTQTERITDKRRTRDEGSKEPRVGMREGEGRHRAENTSPTHAEMDGNIPTYRRCLCYFLCAPRHNVATQGQDCHKYAPCAVKDRSRKYGDAWVTVQPEEMQVSHPE